MWRCACNSLACGFADTDADVESVRWAAASMWRQTRGTSAQIAACSSCVSTKESRSCRRGMTRQWPGVTGRASGKATARSFSATRFPPAKRRKKTQGIGRTLPCSAGQTLLNNHLIQSRQRSQHCWLLRVQMSQREATCSVRRRRHTKLLAHPAALQYDSSRAVSSDLMGRATGTYTGPINHLSRCESPRLISRRAFSFQPGQPGSARPAASMKSAVRAPAP